MRDLAVNNALLLAATKTWFRGRPRWASNGFPDPSHRDSPGPICRRRHFSSLPLFVSPGRSAVTCLVGWHARTDLSHWCLRTFFNHLIAFDLPHSLTFTWLSWGWFFFFLLEWAGGQVSQVIQSLGPPPGYQRSRR